MNNSSRKKGWVNQLSVEVVNRGADVTGSLLGVMLMLMMMAMTLIVELLSRLISQVVEGAANEGVGEAGFLEVCRQNGRETNNLVK